MVWSASLGPSRVARVRGCSLAQQQMAGQSATEQWGYPRTDAAACSYDQQGSTTGWDPMNYALFKAINDLVGNGALDSSMKAAAKYAIALPFLAVAVLSLVRLRSRQIRPVVLTAAALVLTFAIGLLGAAVFKEQRPFQSHRVHQLIAHAGGQSFPSDHATAAFGIALATVAFLSRRWGAALTALAVLIGFARVYVGIHYPGDIGGGLLAALLGVGIVMAVARGTAGDFGGRGSGARIGSPPAHRGLARRR